MGINNKNNDALQEKNNNNDNNAASQETDFQKDKKAVYHRKVNSKLIGDYLNKLELPSNSNVIYLLKIANETNSYNINKKVPGPFYIKQRKILMEIL